MSGMMRHHNEYCQMSYRSVSTDGVRTFWCETHRQWAYQFPDRKVYEYDPHFSDKFLPEEKQKTS